MYKYYMVLCIKLHSILTYSLKPLNIGILKHFGKICTMRKSYIFCIVLHIYLKTKK